jgi:hypothetical protein
MHPNLLNVLIRQVVQSALDFLLRQQVIPDPQRAGAVFNRWLFEEAFYTRRRDFVSIYRYKVAKGSTDQQ